MTATQQKHTPTPDLIHIHTGGKGYCTYLRDINSRIIATFGGFEDGINNEARNKEMEEMQRNIVSRYNSHAALVEASDKARAALTLAKGGTPERVTHSEAEQVAFSIAEHVLSHANDNGCYKILEEMDISDEYGTDLLEMIRKLPKAKAALTLAKGGK